VSRRALANYEHVPLILGQTASNRLGRHRAVHLIRAKWARFGQAVRPHDELANAKLFLTGSFPPDPARLARRRLARTLVQLQITSSASTIWIAARTLDRGGDARQAQRAPSGLFDPAAWVDRRRRPAAAAQATKSTPTVG